MDAWASAAYEVADEKPRNWLPKGSRSSRGKKSVVGGDAVEGQKLDAGIGNSVQAI